MPLFIKDNILKFAGYTLLIFGILVFAVGIGMVFDPDPEASSIGPSIAIVSSAFIVPGIMLIVMGRRASIQERRLKTVAALARAHRRVLLPELAQKAGISVTEIEKVLAEAVCMGLVSGNIDRSTGEFFTDESLNEKAGIRYCSSCGAPLDRVYMAGETAKCPSCGSIMQV